MKRKFLSVLIALVLVFSFSLVTAAPAAAQTDWYVDDSATGANDGTSWTDAFTTIGAAITAASSGDTITVAAGIYPESLVVDTADLTLMSESGRDSTTIQNVGNAGGEQTGFLLMAGATNFTLGGSEGHGFTIEGGTGTAPRLFQLNNAPSGVEVSYNAFDTSDTAGTINTGINIGAAGATGLTISNNTFTGDATAGGEGSIFGAAVVDLTVTNNIFIGADLIDYAVQFYGITGTSVINENTITDYKGAGAVVIVCGTATSGLTINGNTISGCANGIRFADDSGTGDITTVTVTENTLTDNAKAIRIGNGAHIVASDFVIENNNISGSTSYGLQNEHSSEVVTAENNWWGDASGPTHSSNTLGTGDVVSDSVDFIPWLDAAYPSGQPAGLVMNITQSTSHATIQEAIDAAIAGDTIVAKDATYTEDLTVNTANLTLRSLNGKAVTTIQLVDGVGVDIQGGGSGFKLGGASGEGFTVTPHATATTFDIQLANAPSGVEISYNTIDATGDASMGISVGAAGASGLTISNNTFTADSSDGAIWGPNVVDVTVSNNTIAGGAYGIQFSGVTGTSSIDNNTISSCTGSGGVVISNGAGTSGLTITNNTITGCGNGIYFAEYCAEGTAANMTTVTVTYNYISGSNTGDAIKIVDGTHVLASNFTINYNAFINSNGHGLNNAHSSEQVTAEWNWWSACTGPDDVPDKNPYTGHFPTSAETCTANVDFTPWMMHTELVSGWNIYSTPIASGPSTDTISEALDFWGSGTDNYTIGWYFNGATQAWVQVLSTTALQPMQAVYLNMSANATIDVLMSTSNNAPPAMTMYQDWNLVGPAELYNRLVDVSLTDAYYGTGVAADLWGYSKAISPSIHQTAQWTFLRGATATGTASTEYFVPTEGYWVYMVNQGALGGFTYTPITPLP